MTTALPRKKSWYISYIC